MAEAALAATPQYYVSLLLLIFPPLSLPVSLSPANTAIHPTMDTGNGYTAVLMGSFVLAHPERKSWQVINLGASISLDAHSKSRYVPTNIYLILH